MIINISKSREKQENASQSSKGMHYRKKSKGEGHQKTTLHA